MRAYLCDNWTPQRLLYWPLIALIMRSRAKTCIVPMQDYLGLDNESRMNHPSTVGANWTWRVKKTELTPELQQEIRGFTARFGRLP